LSVLSRRNEEKYDTVVELFLKSLVNPNADKGQSYYQLEQSARRFPRYRMTKREKNSEKSDEIFLKIFCNGYAVFQRTAITEIVRTRVSILVGR